MSRVGHLKYQPVVLLILLGLSFLLGLRPLGVGADTLSYYHYYLERASCKCFGHHEPVFDIFTITVSLFGFSAKAYFVVISAAMFTLLYIIVSKCFNSLVTAGVVDPHEKTSFVLIALSIFLLNPLFLQGHINAVRQAGSALFIMMSVVLYQEKKHWPSLMFALLACGIHYSAVMYLPLLSFSYLFGRKSLLLFTLVFVVMSFVYLTGQSEALIKFLSIDAWSFVKNYGASARGRYEEGVRFDFWAVTVGALVFAFVLPQFSRSAALRKILMTYSGLAMVLSIPFLLLGWGVFSNRYLYTTWFFFSLVYGVLFFFMIRATNWSKLLCCLAFIVSLAMFFLIFKGT